MSGVRKAPALLILGTIVAMLSLACAGAPGAAGLQGSAGPQGQAGAKGDMGPAGPAGAATAMQDMPAPAAALRAVIVVDGIVEPAKAEVCPEKQRRCVRTDIFYYGSGFTPDSDIVIEVKLGKDNQIVGGGKANTSGAFKIRQRWGDRAVPRTEVGVYSVKAMDTKGIVATTAVEVVPKPKEEE